MSGSDIPLGKPTQYVSHYAPKLLFPVARSEKRLELDQELLNFHGKDIWNAYELSWLTLKGLPQVAVAEFIFDSSSQYLIESKSFKLYLNSFNQTRFESWAEVEARITSDLSKTCGHRVETKLFPLSNAKGFAIRSLEGELIDDQDIAIEEYSYQPEYLKKQSTTNEIVSETLVSHLLKSNCLITSQPDWASIQIKYQGNPIDRTGLLKYLVSFRNHNEFHEQCVERIFCDIKKYCRTEKLTVYARYTRRGGLDINPWRSDFEQQLPNFRLIRQ